MSRYSMDSNCRHIGIHKHEILQKETSQNTHMKRGLNGIIQMSSMLSLLKEEEKVELQSLALPHVYSSLPPPPYSPSHTKPSASILQ